MKNINLSKTLNKPIKNDPTTWLCEFLCPLPPIQVQAAPEVCSWDGHVVAWICCRIL